MGIVYKFDHISPCNALRCWQELVLLPSPLDALIDALGGSQEVAEMTGRRGRLVRNSRSGRFKYELRPETEETRCVGCCVGDGR